jgi:hypothetical protein
MGFAVGFSWITPNEEPHMIQSCSYSCLPLRIHMYSCLIIFRVHICSFFPATTFCLSGGCALPWVLAGLKLENSAAKTKIQRSTQI